MSRRFDATPTRNNGVHSTPRVRMGALNPWFTTRPKSSIRQTTTRLDAIQQKISPSETGQVFYENRFVEEHAMPTLEWIGKSKVINHHQEVPFRVLERQYSYDEQGQHEEDNGSENMIIRGDNLEALKALLPRYEGRVKCIYIDIKTPRLIQFNYFSADFAA